MSDQAKPPQRRGPKTEFSDPDRPKVRRTVTLTEEADSLLDEESARLGMSRSETVETMVRDWR